MASDGEGVAPPRPGGGTDAADALRKQLMASIHVVGTASSPGRRRRARPHKPRSGGRAQFNAHTKPASPRAAHTGKTAPTDATELPGLGPIAVGSGKEAPLRPSVERSVAAAAADGESSPQPLKEAAGSGAAAQVSQGDASGTEGGARGEAPAESPGAGVPRPAKRPDPAARHRAAMALRSKVEAGEVSTPYERHSEAELLTETEPEPDPEPETAAEAAAEGAHGSSDAEDDPVLLQSVSQRAAQRRKKRTPRQTEPSVKLERIAASFHGGITVGGAENGKGSGAAASPRNGAASTDSPRSAASDDAPGKSRMSKTVGLRQTVDKAAGAISRAVAVVGGDAKVSETEKEHEKDLDRFRLRSKTSATESGQVVSTMSSMKESGAKAMSSSSLTFRSESGLVILPESVAKRRFDLLIMALVVWNVVKIPYDIAFIPDGNTWSGWVVVEYLVDILFVIDVALSFNTAFVDAEGNYVMDKAKIRNRYLHTWFIVDFPAVFPFELLALAMQLDVNFRGLALFKAPRMLRLGRLAKRMEDLAQASAFRLVRLLGVILLMAHWASCLWFVVSESADAVSDDAWSVRAGVSGEDRFTQYIAALYSCLLVLIRNMDIHPRHTRERVLAIVLILIGACMQASIFGSFAVLISNFDRGGSAYKEKTMHVGVRMRQLGLPGMIRQRVYEYYKTLWKTQRSLGGNPDGFIGELSPALEAEVRLFLYQKMVRATPFFQVIGTAATEAIVSRLSTTVYLSGDFIMRQGEFGDWMGFVGRGVVEIVDRDLKPVRQLYENSYLGEESLLGVHKRPATALSVTASRIHVLTRQEFEDVAFMYPTDAKRMLFQLQRQLSKQPEAKTTMIRGFGDLVAAATGVTGVAGATDATGAKSVKGVTGVKGVKGEKGAIHAAMGESQSDPEQSAPRKFAERMAPPPPPRQGSFSKQNRRKGSYRSVGGRASPGMPDIDAARLLAAARSTRSTLRVGSTRSLRSGASRRASLISGLYSGAGGLADPSVLDDSAFSSDDDSEDNESQASEMRILSPEQMARRRSTLERIPALPPAAKSGWNLVRRAFVPQDVPQHRPG